jgi:uncharacterized membrane-anchored protein YitT (DUF2179 family)
MNGWLNDGEKSARYKLKKIATGLVVSKQMTLPMAISYYTNQIKTVYANTYTDNKTMIIIKDIKRDDAKLLPSQLKNCMVGYTLYLEKYME